MVMKLAFIFAILAVSYACPCTDAPEPVTDWNPAQSLDFFKGYVRGAQQSQCYISTCYNNATFLLTEVQVAITTLQNLIDGNFNPQEIIPIICNFNTVYTGWQYLYTVCGIQGFINSFQLFTTNDGLKQLGYNFIMDLKAFIDFFDHIQNCDDDFFTCGFTAGNAYSVLTEWYIPNTHTLQGSDNIDISVIPSFISGFVQGVDCPHLSSVESLISGLFRDIIFLMNGDFTVIDQIIEDWKVVEPAIDAFKFPKVEVDTLLANYWANMSSVMEKANQFGSCESHECGVIAGEIAQILLAH